MSPNVPTVGRAGSDSCLGAGVLQAAKGGGLRAPPGSSGREMGAWMQSGRMNHFSAPFGPRLEPGGAFGSAQLQIEGEILPWICRCLTSTEVLMGLLGLE